MRHFLALAFVIICGGATTTGALAQADVTIPIALISEERERFLPISRLSMLPPDAGTRGAELAINDNNTTGRFTKQSFTLKPYKLAKGGDPKALIDQVARDGIGLVLADARAETLLSMADAASGKPMLLMNIGAKETRLRDVDCRANLAHVAPSLDMLTDALTQFLVWKKWSRWFLLSGANPEDIAYADALRRSAKKFGARVVTEKSYDVKDASARTDSGHAQVQQQLAVLTQTSTEYDVLMVADESEIFGPYVPFRSWSPRPVAGTSGLTAASWHPAHEQWGATQMQNRFTALAGRTMLPLDYHAWVAVRAIGEAATRVKSGEFSAIRDYILGKEFGIAAFKGQKLSFRPWNLQLRQPIVVATFELPVSWSPQEGFLHQRAEVDTLGIDEPETKCKLR